MPKLKFCLVVDAESDFYYSIPSPEMHGKGLLKWRVNNILGKLYKYPKNRLGIVNLVTLLKKYEFPAYFAIVGHLYLKSCKGWPHFSEEKPNAEWFKKAMKEEWYDFDPCSNYKKNPGFYLGDFIEKEMKVPYFRLGLHAFSHEAYLTENEKMIESSIDAGIAAAKLIGIKPEIYDGPWKMIESINEPGKLLRILEKKGFKLVFYSGKNKGLYQKRELGIKPTEKKGKIKLIYTSKEIDGTSKKQRFEEVMGEIKSSLRQDKVYCLSIHDFTWHKNGIRKLERILRFVRKLEKEGLIEFFN